MNKKILALLMALLMVLTSAVAFAETKEIDLPKVIKEYVDENETTLTTDYPSEVLEFDAELIDVKQSEYTMETVPEDLKTATVTTLNTADGLTNTEMTLTYTVPDKVGGYIYKVTEATGTAAGVKYDETTDFYVAVLAYYNNGVIDTIVTMADSLNDSNKYADDTEIKFTNTYTAHDMTIDKKVTGNLGDVNKAFAVKVTLNNPTGLTVKSEIDVTITNAPDADAIKAADGTENPTSIEVGKETIFYVKHGTEIALSNIPDGVTYTVEEVDDPAYTETSSGDLTGTMDADKKITFTNDYSSQIPTGVDSDNMMPYFMLMAFVMIIAAAVVLKKRTVNE